MSNDEAHARTTDPDTSHNAASRVNAKFPEDAQRVEKHLRKLQKPRKTRLELTGKEYRERLIAAGQSTARADSLRRRLSDLLKLGILLDTGKRRGGSRVLTLAPTPNANVAA